MSDAFDNRIKVKNQPRQCSYACKCWPVARDAFEIFVMGEKNKLTMFILYFVQENQVKDIKICPVQHCSMKVNCQSTPWCQFYNFMFNYLQLNKLGFQISWYSVFDNLSQFGCSAFVSFRRSLPRLSSLHTRSEAFVSFFSISISIAILDPGIV